MVSLQTVIIDALWLAGLGGILATVSYMGWYRAVRRWTWKRAWSVPRMLVPFCVSVELFCIGMAMNGALSVLQPVPWWQTAAWSILAILFAILTLIFGIAGIRKGWDIPVERNDHDGP